MNTDGAAHSKSNDEQAIRAVVNNWRAASARGDLKSVLELMADDVVFLVPGKPPFGKEAFAGGFAQMKNVRIEGKSEIEELEIFANHAWMRNRLELTITPPNGGAMHRSGYTLTVLRKN